ncbi:hypothetical protein [Chitinophaga filiformis]|uniref:Uncharacterized protein n=1 Tax=Chitinophaga filiformis TaxID=104663 RepID=A0A1G7ZVS0_CHIFI|nr:hypothetical protein [Chitinophaga filiformis]SDH12727.1 hypothetical protein SAMN04488121_10914 [Chitinophaga filiformis]
MKQIRFLPVVLGLLLAGASCVPPHHPGPPPKPPRPPAPPHGAVQLNIPDTTFQQPTVVIH